MGNPAWDEAAARILVLRLSPFRDVAGSSSHLLVFAECRRAVPGAFVDFGFFPDARDRSILGARKLSYFYGLQSGRSPADFDLVMVSNAFSLELLNLSYLYSGSSLPRRASERAAFEEGRAPIVILGGSNAAAAGALLFPGARSEETSDCLVDGIFFGEGELAIGELASALTLPNASRAERLDSASSIEGFWAARSGRAAARKVLLPYPPRLSGYPVLNSEGADTARLQISAGCPGFCSFCLEGWAFRPYREKPVEEIVEAARELKARTGASRLDVYSYNFNAHSGVFGLMLGLSRVFRRVDFMSQRLDILSESPALAGAELAADKRSFTLGIEGISERMRRYYRKGIDASQIDAALDRLALPAARELKLFYIVAGIEDDRDLAEFAEFAARAARRRLRDAPGQRIIVSAGYLARLPFTPLQYAALCLDRDRLESIARRMEGACSASGIEFRLASDFEEYYADQLISLGGSALAPWLERTPEAGFLYDGRLSRGAGASLELYAGGAGLLDEAFLGEKGEDSAPAPRLHRRKRSRPPEELSPRLFLRAPRGPHVASEAPRRRLGSQARAAYGRQARLRLDPRGRRAPPRPRGGDRRVSFFLDNARHLGGLARGRRLRVRRRGGPFRQGRKARGNGRSVLGPRLLPPSRPRPSQDGQGRRGRGLRTGRDLARLREPKRLGGSPCRPRPRGGGGPQVLARRGKDQLRRGAGGSLEATETLGPRRQKTYPRRGPPRRARVEGRRSLRGETRAGAQGPPRRLARADGRAPWPARPRSAFFDSRLWRSRYRRLSASLAPKRASTSEILAENRASRSPRVAAAARSRRVRARKSSS